MSLLSICQDVADSIPIDRPNSIIGAGTETAKLLLRCATEAGQSLYRRYNWVALQTEHTFSTVASTADYSLPSDFGRLIDTTLWDRTNYWEMRGPLTPQSWQKFKGSVLSDTVSTRKRYRIRNVSGDISFSIDPTPDSADSLVFEYISSSWCAGSDGTGKSKWGADSDVPVVDSWLLYLHTKWRTLNRLGMAYDEEKAEAERETNNAAARDGGSPVLQLSPSNSPVYVGPYNVPDTGFGT